MDQYVAEFSARDVDGEQLLQLDGTKLKVRREEPSRVRACSTCNVCGAVAGSGRPQLIGPQRPEAAH